MCIRSFLTFIRKRSLCDTMNNGVSSIPLLSHMLSTRCPVTYRDVPAVTQLPFVGTLRAGNKARHVWESFTLIVRP